MTWRLRTAAAAARWLAAGVAVAVMIGCGSGSGRNDGVVRHSPKGRVLKGGLPIEIDASRLPPGDPGLQVIFIKMGTTDAGTEIPAQIIDPKAGTFELKGIDGNGIPEGKYRVAVILAPVGSADAFKGKYDKKNSKIEVEVKSNQDVVIDVDKPTG